MKRETVLLPVDVEWDRRAAERRALPKARPPLEEQRKGERRREPPLTWDDEQFVVVRDGKE